MTDQLDPLDQKLLNELQSGVPLAAEPFAVLADRLDADAGDLIARLRRLKSDKVVRQISAIFDTKALGYESSLVAAKVDAARIEQAADVISAHPGVSHNYERNHEYNLWYTVAVPPDSRLGLGRTVDILHAESGASVTRLMPTLRLFKIGVKFDMTGQREVGARTDEEDAPSFSQRDREEAAPFELTETNKRIVRVLQQDLPLEPRPFDAWAEQAGVSVAELLASAERFGQDRHMRRFAAVLHHRKAGFGANAMGAWAVPEAQVEELGVKLAGFAAVSHCYLRPTYSDWPYNIFTMVHGRSREDCEAELEAMRAATGDVDMRALYSTREFKKVRVRYFTPETEQWEAQHGAR